MFHATSKSSITNSLSIHTFDSFTFHLFVALAKNVSHLIFLFLFFSCHSPSFYRFHCYLLYASGYLLLSLVFLIEISHHFTCAFSAFSLLLSFISLTSSSLQISQLTYFFISSSHCFILLFLVCLSYCSYLVSFDLCLSLTFLLHFFHLEILICTFFTPPISKTDGILDTYLLHFSLYTTGLLLAYLPFVQTALFYIHSS